MKRRKKNVEKPKRQRHLPKSIRIWTQECACVKHQLGANSQRKYPVHQGFECLRQVFPSLYWHARLIPPTMLAALWFSAHGIYWRDRVVHRGLRTIWKWCGERERSESGKKCVWLKLRSIFEVQFSIFYNKISGADETVMRDEFNGIYRAEIIFCCCCRAHSNLEISIPISSVSVCVCSFSLIFFFVASAERDTLQPSVQALQCLVVCVCESMFFFRRFNQTED